MSKNSHLRQLAHSDNKRPFFSIRNRLYGSQVFCEFRAEFFATTLCTPLSFSLGATIHKASRILGDIALFLALGAFRASLVVPCSSPGRSASQRWLERPRCLGGSVRVACRSFFVGPSSTHRRNPSPSVTSPTSVRSIAAKSSSAIPLRVNHVDGENTALRDLDLITKHCGARETSHGTISLESR